MKFSLAIFASLATSALAATTVSQISAESKFGQQLLSKSRRADQAADDAAEDDMTWITGYNLKFIGCHHVAQWNADEDNDQDAVKVETIRLARFRLCKEGTCDENYGLGCKTSYGDYIVDMDSFLDTYMENKFEVEQANCEYYSENTCGCDNDQVDDMETCEQECFKSAGMSECYEEVYYDGDGNQVENVNIADYTVCNAFNAGGRRKLEDGDEGGEYYIGPYCTDNGGGIVLGMFTDEDCTNFADNYGGTSTFKAMTGRNLPYSSESVVGNKCYSCTEEGNDDDAAEDEVSQVCGTLYEDAGKCETKMSDRYNLNENACTFMEGIKVVNKNNVIIGGATTSNKVASAFIGIFAVSFVLLGSYVYYLKTKLDRGSINLSD